MSPESVAMLTDYAIKALLFGAVLAPMIQRKMKKGDTLEAANDKRISASIDKLASSTEKSFDKVSLEIKEMTGELRAEVKEVASKCEANKEHIAENKMEIYVVTEKVKGITDLKFSVGPNVPPNGGAASV